MKKIFVLLVVFSVMFSLTACTRPSIFSGKNGLKGMVYNVSSGKIFEGNSTSPEEMAAIREKTLLLNEQANKQVEEEIRDWSSSLEERRENWQKYSNQQYGFEINYPKNWKMSANEKQGAFTVFAPSSPPISIKFTKDQYADVLAGEQQKFVDWDKKSLEKPSGEINDVKFAELPAKEFLYFNPIGMTTRITVVELKDYTLLVGDVSGATDPIVETFRFIK